MSKIILVRGLPGSGKSTYAKKLNCLHVEADMFFVKDGEYNFQPGLIASAHEWCQKAAFNAMDWDMDVVVTNTFTQLWEMQPYLDMAAELDADVQVIKLTTQFGSVHGVPETALKAMMDRWEDYPGEEIVS